MANVNALNAESARTIERLRNLPKEFAGKNGGPIRTGLAKAAGVIRDEAKLRAPVGKDTPLPGRLKLNVINVRMRRPESQPGRPVEGYIVRVRGSGKEGGRARRKFARRLVTEGASGASARSSASKLTPNDAYYWLFVEFGTAKMPARPFLRPAFEASKERAVDTFSDELRKAVLRIEKRVTRASGMPSGGEE